ncbi:zinc-dependent alcohol dehydrogenase family protein [Roseovarius salinarum]|uniref:zinc-dependent alcohol dehydrogenase family protein n=1 Tax=Roseovarius salinarum TaxID=1981892 RepID=UPI000C32777B|nr:zinc-dependent alcohol dehydrogenase family protein [Roseovarius salinarum]
MKAALITEFDGPIDISQVPDPTCPRDGAVVAVQACGVCRSDHHAWKGADPDVALPHVMGHEFAGEVIETGPECHAFRPGDRVTAPFILGCGTCADCRGGEPTVCAGQTVIGFTVWGAFAERVAIPWADYNLVRLPDRVDYAAAAGMGCRVTTAFRGVVDRAALRPGEWLAVHGCGGVGLSAVMIGAALGARVLAVDIDPGSLDMADALGADATLDAGKAGGDVGAAVQDMTGGGAHVSVEALGRTETFEASLRGLRKLGRHVQIGMPVGGHANPPLPLLDLVYARQLTLHGTRGIGAHRFAALFEMIAAGRMDPARLVTRRIALSQAEGALREMDGFAGRGVTVIDRMDA